MGVDMISAHPLRRLRFTACSALHAVNPTATLPHRTISLASLRSTSFLRILRPLSLSSSKGVGSAFSGLDGGEGGIGVVRWLGETGFFSLLSSSLLSI